MKPTYSQVLKYARTAVKNEAERPLHGGYYDNQSVLVDVVNHFDELTTDTEEDEDLIREAVREAEGEYNKKHGVEL
jgi:hypothetical protein